MSVNLRGARVITRENRVLEIGIVHKPDDPWGVARVNVAGPVPNGPVGESDLFLSYRGSLDQCIECLATAIFVMKRMREEGIEPDIEPEEEPRTG